MKLWLKKIYVFLTGGGQGLNLSIGTDAQVVTPSFATTLTQGQDAQQDAMTPQPTLPMGQDAQVMTISATGVGTHATGTDSQAMAMSSVAPTITTGLETQGDAFVPAPALPTGSDSQVMAFASLPSLPIGNDSQVMAFTALPALASGQDSAAFAASAVVNIDQFTTAASNTRNAGSTDWASPTNAQGEFDAANASFTLAAGLALTVGDATLKCTIPAIGATPSGFTRGLVKIAIRHLWDLVLTLPLVDTASTTIELRDFAGTTLIATLLTRTEDSVDNNQATLLAEEFDITPPVVSEAQLAAGLKVWCRAAASLSLVTSGNMSWGIDAVHLRTSFSRSGLS